jgi:hypothetical protein
MLSVLLNKVVLTGSTYCLAKIIKC